MNLIIGLGNPGQDYQNHRHNVGQYFVDRLNQPPAGWIFLKSNHFMNQSGIYVKKMVDYYQANLSDLYLVHDDLDLRVGEWRLHFGRGGAGHHGVESVIRLLGSQNFWRCRIGIDHPGDSTPVEDYVLRPFTATEQKVIDQTIDKIISRITTILGR
jgi:PTH1 family peptidyl-tRNA hydrolase